MKLHWISRYLGIPYLEGGRTTEGLDCLGLLQVVYAEEYGLSLDLPRINSEDIPACASLLKNERIASWIELRRPEDGCAVGMGHGRTISHVGVYAEADGGKVVHCCKRSGIVADNLLGIRLRGFPVVRFYRHFLWPG